MKVWHGYGSEHSMNLVMIGHFKAIPDVQEAKNVIDELTQRVNAEVESGQIEIGERTTRFSKEMREFLLQKNISIVGPAELEQFAYEFRITTNGKKLIVTTEESEVSVFLKLLINMGARLEVFSAHDHPDLGYGRGERS